MFAVIKTGGKQYKVQVGSVLKVEKLAAEVNSDVEIKEVLLVGEGVVGVHRNTYLPPPPVGEGQGWGYWRYARCF